MSFKHKPFMVAFESIEEQPEENLSGLDITPDELETHILEEQFVDIQCMCDLIEESVAQANNLEQLSDIAVSSIPRGGLDLPGVQLMSNAVENFYSNLGITKSQAISTEAFSSTNTKIQNTQIAIESIMDGIRKAWEAIVKFIVTIWNSVKDFFAKLFDTHTKNKEKAKKLTIAIKSIEKNKPKQEDFEDASLALRMRCMPDSQEVTVFQFIKGVKTTERVTDYLSNTVMAMNMRATPLAHISSLDDIKDTNIIQEVYEPLKMLPVHAHPKIKELPGLEIGVSDPMPGSQALVVTIPLRLKNKDYDTNKFQDIITTMTGLKVLVQPMAHVLGVQTKPLLSNKVEVLKPETMKELLKEINSISDNGVDDARKALDKFNSTNQAMVATIKKLMDKETTPENKERERAVQFLIPKLNSLISSIITGSTKIGIQVVATGLALIDKSITFYDKHGVTNDEPTAKDDRPASGMKMLAA